MICNHRKYPFFAYFSSAILFIYCTFTSFTRFYMKHLEYRKRLVSFIIWRPVKGNTMTHKHIKYIFNVQHLLIIALKQHTDVIYISPSYGKPHKKMHRTGVRYEHEGIVQLLFLSRFICKLMSKFKQNLRSSFKHGSAVGCWWYWVCNNINLKLRPLFDHLRFYHLCTL